MTTSPQGPLLFGDLLARARQSWVREMTIRLTNEGFSDYKASDALALRILRAGSTPFARFTKILGTSRQAAMKVVDGLIRRGPGQSRRRPGRRSSSNCSALAGRTTVRKTCRCST